MLRRFRAISVKKLFLGCLIPATLVVLLTIPARQQGWCDNSMAEVPFRAMRPHEAAILLNNKSPSEKKYVITKVLKLSPQKVVLGSTNFIETSTSNSCWGSFGYGFYLISEIDRAALERELKRKLTAQDVQPEAFQGMPVAFDSRYLWLYATIEILFLTACLTIGLLILQTIPNFFWFIPAVVMIYLGFFVLLFLLISFYSPAFLDADIFIQRILLENLFLWGGDISFINPVLWIVALLSISMDAVFRTLRRSR